MKRIIATIIILFATPVFSCPDLIGTWQSSKKLSMEYNIANVEMEPHTINFLNNILGVLKVTYKQDKVRIHGAPTKVIEIKGKRHEFPYEEETFRYEIQPGKGGRYIFRNALRSHVKLNLSPFYHYTLKSIYFGE